MAVVLDPERYTRWALPHPVVLFWFLFPASAFNELLLGQRIPRVMLIDRTVNKPLMERTLVPCDRCGERHDGRLWSWSNAFGHWFGFVCPSCGAVIPCLWSLTSLLVLAVTIPLWIVPALLWKERWLEFERRRIVARQHKAPVAAADTPWMKLGAAWGIFMWLIMAMFSDMHRQQPGGGIDWIGFLASLPLWMAGGFAYSFGLKYFMSRRPRRVVS